MTHDVQARVRWMIFELTAVPAEDVRLDDDLFTDLRFDSVSALELIGMLDEEFGLEVEIEEVRQVRTVRDVVELATQRLAHA